MRIRKHAAKLLLGSACPPHHSPPTPPPPPADDDRSASVGDGLFLCQMNCSPWDVMDSNSFYFHQEGGGGGGGGGGGMEDIMGNVFGLGDEEGILGISEALTRSSVAVGEPYLYCEDEDDSDQKKKVNKRRRRRRRKKEEINDDDKDDEKTSSVVAVIAKSGGRVGVVGQFSGICKKNDGKGWHCNRPANPHHTLCDHHLTQLKSYSSTRHSNSSNNVAREEADSDRGGSVSDLARVVKKDDVPRVKTSRRPNTKAAVAASSNSAGDGYYYYSGFGLRRGKTRSDGGEEEFAGKNESESGDGSVAPIAGDDLHHHDDVVKIVGNVDNSKGRIRRKKRGRKPIKARSLKSLL